MEVKKQLKNNLPSHLREHPNVDGLFGAVGDLLDEMKENIDDFSFAYDYEKIPEGNFDDFAGQMGINYPRNLAQQNKKILLRDIISVYRAKGTEKAIKQLFKLVGWKVDIDYIWIKKGTKNKEFIYPSDYFFGVESVYDDGVYADVVDYLNQEYDKVQISGENYASGASVSKFELLKTPYIKVVVTAEDYALFTQDFVDADGNVYKFTDSEKFEIVQEIFDFFFESGRPAHVAIIEIATPFRLNDDVQHDTNDSANLANVENESMFFTEIGEYDFVEINANSSFDPTRVYFNIPFPNVPIVVAYVQSNNESALVHARVTNITEKRFDVYLQSQDGSALPKNETVNYIAVVPGVHTLQDGLVVEANSIDTQSVHRGGSTYGGDTVTFEGGFSVPPAILATINTHNVVDFTASNINSVTKSDFRIQQEKLETGTPVEQETIGWIALSVGQYTIERSILTVETTTESVGDVSTSFNFSGGVSFSGPPMLFAHGRTGNNKDGYIVRSDNLDDQSVDFFAQEDTVNDLETGHSEEQVSFVAIEWTGPSDITKNRIYREKTEEVYLSSLDNAVGTLDGTLTFDHPMTRYVNFGEYYGGLQIDDDNFKVYANYPTKEYTGRIYSASETGTKNIIPVMDDARVIVSAGEDTTVYVYKTIDDRIDIANGNRNLIFVNEIYGPLSEFEMNIRYATGIAINVDNFGKVYGFVYEGSTSAEDYGTVTTSSTVNTDLGSIVGADAFSGFVHVLVGHNTDPIKQNDYYDLIGENNGQIENHTNFYGDNGSIEGSATYTEDYGSV